MDIETFNNSFLGFIGCFAADDQKQNPGKFIFRKAGILLHATAPHTSAGGLKVLEI
jgi:hypothetical protein